MEFTVDIVKKIIADSLPEVGTKYETTVELSLFVVSIVKKLTQSMTDTQIGFAEKLDLIRMVGNEVSDEFEATGVITFELAQEFRDVLNNTESAKALFAGFADFMASPPEVKKELISKFLCNCIVNLLGNR